MQVLFIWKHSLHILIIFIIIVLTVLFSVQAETQYPILKKGDREEIVEKLQKKLQDKGFLINKCDTIFGLQTKLAVKLFQQFNGLKIDGVVGPRTWEALNRKERTYRIYTVKRGDNLWDLSEKFSVSLEEIKTINNKSNGDYIKIDEKLKIPGKVKAKNVEIIHWEKVNKMIDIKEKIILTDVETGLNFRVRRLGGSNHADVEPLTIEDTRVFKQIYGGDWSWERRAIIVHINGKQIAASINGQPHAHQCITDNQFPGHICLHFKGSKLHKEEEQDNKHQKMVEKAGTYSWPLGIF